MSSLLPPPIRVGQVVIDPPLVLAPLAGISDAPVRLLCKEQGAGLVCNEFVSGYGLYYGNQRSQEYLRFADAERPVSCQIFGAEPAKLAVAAKAVADAGADLLDLNCGCSVPKVVRTGAGASLLREPDTIARIVEALVAAVDIPVTVKMRLGWNQASRNAPLVARLCAAAGARMVAVHGRFATQGYRGQADWAAIGEVKAAVDIPVLGNGDVRSGADAAALLAASGCDGIMIGRAVQGDPWIFARVLAYLRDGRELPPPSLEERLATGRRHGEMLRACKPPERAAREMRRHLAWYVHGLPGASALRAAINEATTWDTMLALLDEFGARLREAGVA